MKKPKKLGIEMINMYGDLGEWLFIHSLPWIHLEKYIKKELLKKIVWRTWGHDSIPPLSLKDIIKKEGIINKVSLTFRLIIGTNQKEWETVINQFHAIGTTNVIDDIQISTYFNNVKKYRMPYVGNNDIILPLINETVKKDNFLHVMVGHSGYNDDHCKLLMLLKKI